MSGLNCVAYLAAWQHIGMQVFHDGGNMGSFACICKTTREVVCSIFEKIRQLNVSQINNSRQLRLYVAMQSCDFQKSFDIFKKEAKWVEQIDLEELQKRCLRSIAYLIKRWDHEFRVHPCSFFVRNFLFHILQRREESPENIFMCALLSRNKKIENQLLPRIDVCRITTDPRKGSDYKTTALHVAVEVGNARIIGPLVQRGLSLGSLDEQGRTPLHLTRSLLIARELVLLGGVAILDMENRDRQTPLEAAAADPSCNEIFLYELIRLRVNASEISLDQFNLKFKPALEYLRATEKQSMLCGKICGFGPESIAITLIQMGIFRKHFSNRASAWTILQMTCLQQRGQIVNLLIERGIDINMIHNDTTILHDIVTFKSFRWNCVSMIEFLLTYNASTTIRNKNDETPLEAYLRAYELSEQSIIKEDRIVQVLIRAGSPKPKNMSDNEWHDLQALYGLAL